MLENEKLFSKLYKLVSKKLKENPDFETGKKIIELLWQYAESRKNKKLIHVMNVGAGKYDFSKISLISSIISAFGLSYALQSIKMSSYLCGISDCLIVLMLVAMCLYDAVLPKKSIRKTVIAFVFDILLVVMFAVFRFSVLTVLIK